MQLYVVRHAIAFERDPVRWPDDAERPLTSRGTRRFRKAAKGFRRLGARVDVLLSSPFVRAWDTARLLHKHARWPEPIRCDALTGDRTPGDVVEELRQYGEASSVALVGHEPHLHELFSYLLTGDHNTLSVELRKGGAALLESPEGLVPGAMLLRWSLPPRALRAFARA